MVCKQQPHPECHQDQRAQIDTYSPIHINSSPMEIVNSFKFLAM